MLFFRGYPLSHDEEVHRVSAKTGDNTGNLKKIIWLSLGLVRVYTKTPGKPAETKPLTLPAGSNIRKVVEKVHKTMLKNFRFARIWGSAKFDGAQVGLSHVVKDRDVVEIHTK